jgi:pilus assembly protein CpaB
MTTRPPGFVGGAAGSPAWTPPGARAAGVNRGRRRRGRRGGRDRQAGRPWLRRAVAGVGAVALAALAGVVAGRPVTGGQAAPAPGVAVLVLARDLPAGAVPQWGDLRTVQLPATAVPPDAVPADAVPPAGTAASGGSVADAVPPPAAGVADGDGAVRPAAGPGGGDAVAGGGGVGRLAVAVRRGDLLTRRLLGGGGAGAPGGLRAYTLPVGEGVEAGPLASGDRVDVLAASGGRARTVLRGAPVLRLVPGSGGRAALVVVGVTAGQAETLAAARAAATLTLVQAPPGAADG